MNGLYVERRTYSKASILSQDIAHHLFTRQGAGKVVVVADRPSAFMGAVKKQWAKVVRQAQNERSRTLDAQRIEELTQEIERMQALQFAAAIPGDMLEADVSFGTPEQVLAASPVCYTMYVACPLATELLYQLTVWMPKHSLVVLYDKTKQRA